MKILSVVGARPNFMKVAPIIREIDRYNRDIPASKKIKHKLVHTGQHYDEAMSDAFFRDLHLPRPDVYLGVGSGSHAAQTAEIMKKFEGVLLEQKPDVVIVVGDVNSTVACAVVSSKISFDSEGTRPLIAHVEAGLRSFDRTMPEEINRILTDHISDFLFVTEASGIRNLKNEGIPSKKIHFVGNTMIDTLLTYHEMASQSSILDRLGLTIRNQESGSRSLEPRLRSRLCPQASSLRPHHSVLPYALLTLHRPSNVDRKDRFLGIVEALSDIARQMPVLFPCHPRTKNTVEKFRIGKYFRDLKSPDEKIVPNRIHLMEPLGYIDFVSLMMNARVVLTDSGGIQEETTCLGVPCITLRENTERPVTVEQGTNILAGITAAKIRGAFKKSFNGRALPTRPEKWDGKASMRIVSILAKSAHERR